MDNISYKKVSFIGLVDYANCMTQFSKSINKFCHGFKSKVICKFKNKISFTLSHDYDLALKNSEDGQFRIRHKAVTDSKQWLRDSDHIIIAEEIIPNLIRAEDINRWFPNDLQTIKEICGEILGMDIVGDTKAGKLNNLHLFHTGTIYRSQPDIFNLIGARYFNKIIHGVDLYRLSLKRDKDIVIYGAYENESTINKISDIINNKFKSGVVKIFHLPTNREKKGTRIITSVAKDLISRYNQKNIEENIKIKYVLITPDTFKPLKDLMNINNGWVPNSAIIKIKELSHIYIDAFNPEIGYFGVSAVEALMAGNITLCTINNFTNEAKNAADKNVTINTCPVIHLGDTSNQIRKALESVLQKPIDELKQLAKESFAWYLETSTHAAVAKKFKKEVLL